LSPNETQIAWVGVKLIYNEHTTCLTKHKLKRNEEKQNKEKQKQVLPWSEIYILFSAQIQECKIYDEEI